MVQPVINLELSFMRLERYYSQNFRQAMQIYRHNFPPATRLPIGKIRQLLQAGRYRLLVAGSGQVLCAIALVWLSPDGSFVHLDYLAVADDFKHRGIGTAFYVWLTDHLEQLAPGAQLLTLEVENHLVTFYHRHHTQVLEKVPYLFPGLHGPIPMNLMVYDLRRRTSLSRATVKHLILSLYQGIHNRGATDLVLQSFISKIPNQVKLA